MPQTHTVGRVFLSHLTVPIFGPLIERGVTQETDVPFRKGVSLVIRIPGTYRRLILGRWVGSVSEDEAVSNALGGVLGTPPVSWDISQLPVDSMDDTDDTDDLGVTIIPNPLIWENAHVE